VARSDRKIEKKTKGREGVYDENSDFLYEKRPIGGEKNRNYIASYSLEFRRTTSGSMPLGSP
jgi:hypothetical protein